LYCHLISRFRQTLRPPADAGGIGAGKDRFSLDLSQLIVRRGIFWTVIFPFGKRFVRITLSNEGLMISFADWPFGKTASVIPA
jgi:hypothetical protein